MKDKSVDIIASLLHLNNIEPKKDPIEHFANKARRGLLKEKLKVFERINDPFDYAHYNVVKM